MRSTVNTGTLSSAGEKLCQARVVLPEKSCRVSCPYLSGKEKKGISTLMKSNRPSAGNDREREREENGNLQSLGKSGWRGGKNRCEAVRLLYCLKRPSFRFFSSDTWPVYCSMHSRLNSRSLWQRPGKSFKGSAFCASAAK